MTLTRTRPIQAGFPTALDDRKLEAGIVVREGIFPSPTSVANVGQGIATAGTGWGVQAAPFVAATKRGTTPYGLAYGTAYCANDSQVVAAWTVPAAPGSGIQYSRLWIRVTDPDQGDSTSGNDGPAGAARAVPVYGVTSAAPGAGLPALPAGVLEVAQVAVPSSAASIAGATITNVYAFAQLVGGVIYCRNATELAALTGLMLGDKVLRLDAPMSEWRYDGTTLRIQKAPVTYVLGGGFNTPLGEAVREGRLVSIAMDFIVGTGGTVMTLDAAFRPTRTARGWARNETAGNEGPCYVANTGVIALVATLNIAAGQNVSITVTFPVAPTV